ncbi:MAG: aminodeoxychorismate synthase component I [Ekhidna sp.]
MLSKSDAISLLNKLGKEGTPFKFYCDFLGEEWCVEESTSDDSVKAFQLEIAGETLDERQKTLEASFEKFPIPFSVFQEAFKKVIHQINIGNSFLTNLTFQTPVETNLSLGEIFQHSRAKYKLLVPDQFVVFSPETFIQIKNSQIYSYPMKGTINADVPNAASTILADVKEKAEHVTIVDLIRNDLSQVAKNVEVTKFRYIDELSTNEKNLLQVSSEIKGNLPEDWKANLGSILSKLLPAGSISGAPKQETVKIIQETENYNRRFYTGICGHFDGQSLDTGVMIRFIHQQGDRLSYHSGGGITSFSEAEKEYQEMVDKVYLAFSL